MREIKFRGKRVDNGEWKYGYLFDDDLIDSNKRFIGSIVIENGEIVGQYFSEVFPETIGQFTGLKDKNGKEIYEGDVCKSEWQDGEYIVSFSTEEVGSCGCCYGSFSGSGFVGEKTDEEGLTVRCYLACEKRPEIIGNIHEVKE